MTALPTTATTRKQTAARGPRKKSDNGAEASSLTINTATLDIKRDLLGDMPEADISNELLDHFHTLGWTREEIRDVAGAWLITSAELATWEANMDADSETERARVELETAKLAAQMEACILNRGKPQTPAIVTASEERLLEFIDYYEQELDDLYPSLNQPDGPDRLEALDQWRKLNAYLWECKTIAGVTPVTYKILTGGSLENRLDQALKQEETMQRGTK